MQVIRERKTTFDRVSVSVRQTRFDGFVVENFFGVTICAVEPSK